MSKNKILIAGNWKMNKTTAEARSLVSEIVAGAGSQTKVDVAVCPPFTALESAAASLKGSSVMLGAQNVYVKDSGAYTGEISASMLKEVGCSCVILGHSERRQYFGESDAFINEKTKVAQAAGLLPIVCVGETLAEREAGKMLEVVSTQTTGALAGVTDAANLVIAYEPVWAIGTGKTATPEMAQEVHAAIRALLVKQFGEAGNKVRILYGGSMNPANASELLDQADIDGGLIGGAALKSASFLELVAIASSKGGCCCCCGK
ncbi:MAG: triose-phosphate isomerase [Opitutales bacterium]|nr:triose-phosphate isomerase [Opitutales bacterium]